MSTRTVTYAPIARLTRNLEDYTRVKPKSALGYYALGRIHALGFAQARDTISVETGLDRIPPRLESSYIPPQMEAEALQDYSVEHLVAAIRSYRKSTEIDPTWALPYLGLGWILEMGVELSPTIGMPPDYPPCGDSTLAIPLSEVRKLLAEFESPEIRSQAFNALLGHLPCSLSSIKAELAERSLMGMLLRRVVSREWEDLALKAYRKAYDLSSSTQAKAQKPQLDQIRLEAAQKIIELLAWHRIVGEMTIESMLELNAMSIFVAERGHSSRAISPIIFPRTQSLAFENLINPEASVLFDLEGDNSHTRWSWVTKSAAFLVWDPRNKGKIDSGLQLFGSRTWWIFWNNGYQPLASLDDNRNGWLEGEELNGMCVWWDKDENGISSTDEVVTCKKYGIVRIATFPDSARGNMLLNTKGLVLSDRTVLPTYDWIAESVNASEARVAKVQPRTIKGD